MLIAFRSWKGSAPQKVTTRLGQNGTRFHLKHQVKNKGIQWLLPDCFIHLEIFFFWEGSSTVQVESRKVHCTDGAVFGSNLPKQCFLALPGQPFCWPRECEPHRSYGHVLRWFHNCSMLGRGRLKGESSHYDVPFSGNVEFFFLRDLHKNALSIHMKISRIWVDFFSIHFQHSKVVVFFPNPLREVPLLADVGQWPSYKRKDQHEDTSHDDDW